MMVAVGHEFHSICCGYYYLALTSVHTPLVGYLFLEVPFRELTAVLVLRKRDGLGYNTVCVHEVHARIRLCICCSFLLGTQRQTYVTSLSSIKNK
jgi:hypothetical protein